MVIILILWFELLIFALVMSIRNSIVAKVRKTRLNSVSNAARQIIAEGNYSDWERLYDEFALVTYNQMLWNFRCWTYSQFYPDPCL